MGYYESNNSPGEIRCRFSRRAGGPDRREVEKKLHESYFTEPMTIRPYQDTSKLYLNARTFRKLFPGRRPDFIGKPLPAPAQPKLPDP